MRIIFLSVFTFMSVYIGCAQEIIPGLQDRYILGLDQYMNYEHIERNMAKTATYNDVKGSPFMSKEFIDGQIKLNDGKIYKGPLRYDIYADQVEFKTSGGEIYAVQNPETIESAVIGDHIFKYLAPEKNKSIKGFYDVLKEGSYTLLEKHQILLKDPQAARPYIEAQPAKFITKESKFYILDATVNYTEIKSKKDLIVSEANTEKLESFIKKNNIKPSDRNDLIRFVEFLNQ